MRVNREPIGTHGPAIKWTSPQPHVLRDPQTVGSKRLLSNFGQIVEEDENVNMSTFENKLTAVKCKPNVWIRKECQWTENVIGISQHPVE